ncbi:inositol monophosphatase [Hoyosella sp. G463]|uniref:Inositol-1-monophosphatase n=1 Tax=Lolliginicoccus lacisalsi TaxID=2742202 RepID=A0A927PL11_9ACTN|nr:inositol monophosphatase family protein [Lolliginicoccus lacisalsi]MBD8505369.1 inositol monophosphatase [Lolliginicoccus lacisalsi]
MVTVPEPSSHKTHAPARDDAESLRVIAEQLASEAADLVRGRRAEVIEGAAPGGAVSTKSTSTDPVTIVDQESEALIRARLATLRPDDTILGEEGGGATSTTGIRWVIDPIDGTVNFLYGIDAYAVSIAAQLDGITLAGAVADVPGHRIYSAARGHGAWQHSPGAAPIRLRCTTETRLGHTLVATGFAYDPARRAAQGSIVAQVLPHVRDIRRIGSAAIDLCLLAAGRVDAYYEHGLHPWDWAAASLIAEEAGAVLAIPPADSSGSDGIVTIGAAPGVAEAFQGLLGEAGALRAL